MIWDCFTFFEELDLLEMRLHIMADVVDRFVIVEGDRTFTGAAKTLHFADHRERFAAFADRIVHVAVRDFPPFAGSAWDFETFQRNAIIRGLTGMQPDDLVLVSDVDEIINPAAVTAGRYLHGVKAFRQRMFYYWLNCEVDVPWTRARMVRGRDFTSAQAVRMFNGKPDFGPPGPRRTIRKLGWKLRGRPRHGYSEIPDGGWHFSYLGEPDRVLRKIQAFSHTEYNTPDYTDPAQIQQRMAEGKDLFGRHKYRMRFVPMNDSYPAWLLEHLDRYPGLVKDGALTP